MHVVNRIIDKSLIWIMFIVVLLAFLFIGFMAHEFKTAYSTWKMSEFDAQTSIGALLFVGIMMSFCPGLLIIMGGQNPDKPTKPRVIIAVLFSIVFLSLTIWWMLLQGNLPMRQF